MFNPFSTRQTRPGAIRYRYAVDDVINAEARHRAFSSLLEELDQHRLVAIVGPHGSGKSTLLRDWSAELTDRFGQPVMVSLSRDPSQNRLTQLRQQRQNARLVQRMVHRNHRGGLLILDGAEQLSGYSRWRLRQGIKRHCGFALVTSHRPLRGFKTVWRTQIREELIQCLLDQLTYQAPADIRPRLRELTETVDLHAVANVRDLWSQLYDRYAETQTTKLPPRWPSD